MGVTLTYYAEELLQSESESNDASLSFRLVLL